MVGVVLDRYRGGGTDIEGHRFLFHIVKVKSNNLQILILFHNGMDE